MKRILVGAALLTGVAAGPAAADQIINYSSASQYTYELTLLPDIDQRRWGLPNLGNMYCCPTACANLAAWAANHGFGGSVIAPDTSYIYYYWPAFFDDVTDLVADVGTLMDTDPFDGTSGSGGHNGAIQSMSPGFFVLRYSQGNGYWPRFDDMASHAVNGALIGVVVGWYDDEFVTNRDGGHCMSAAKMIRSGSNRTLKVCDPASDEGNLFEQSPFTRETYPIVSEVRLINGGFQEVDRLAGLGGGGNVGILDAFYAYLPLMAITTSNDDFSALFSQPNTPNGPVIGQNVYTATAPLASLALDAPTNTVYALVEADDVTPGHIESFNLVDRAPTLQLAEVDAPIDMVISRLRRLYLAHGNALTCYRLRNVPQFEAELIPPGPVNAIAYDNLHDEVIAASIEGHALYLWNKTLTTLVDTIPLDPDFVFLNASMSIAVHPLDGSIWLTSPISPGVYHVTRDGGVELIEHPAITTPVGLSITDLGHLVVANGTSLVELEPVDGEWVVVENSIWSGVPGTGTLLMPCSMTNFDPETMVGPAYRNELPDTFGPSDPWCRADLNGDAAVDAADLAMLLARWNDSTILADLDESGTVGPGDLAAMLAAWGACPE